KERLESLLPAVCGVQQASANHLTGTVLILFRSNVDLGEMLAALNELVEIIEADLSRERGRKKPAPKRPRNISLPGEPSQRSWHSSSTAKVLSHLRSSERGLSK